MTDNDNYPPITPLENEISQVQFPYLAGSGEICTGIDIGYRAAVEKYGALIERYEKALREIADGPEVRARLTAKEAINP